MIRGEKKEFSLLSLSSPWRYEKGRQKKKVEVLNISMESPMPCTSFLKHNGQLGVGTPQT